jgi:hypothetical protein
MVFAAALLCHAASCQQPYESALDPLALLHTDVMVTISLVRTWVRAMRQAFSAAHRLLHRHYHLDHICTDGIRDDIGFVHDYLVSILGTGPPDKERLPSAVATMLGRCVSKRRFFLGTPSQLRRRVPTN